MKFNVWSERVLNLGSPDLKASALTTGLQGLPLLTIVFCFHVLNRTFRPIANRIKGRLVKLPNVCKSVPYMIASHVGESGKYGYFGEYGNFCHFCCCVHFWTYLDFTQIKSLNGKVRQHIPYHLASFLRIELKCSVHHPRT